MKISQIATIDDIRRELQLLDNTSLNILIAEHFYKYQVVSRTTFPNNRVKYYHNIKRTSLKGRELEEPLPNYVKELKKLLVNMMKAGYNVYVEKHDYLFRAVVNEYEAVDDFERSIAIALLLNILTKDLKDDRETN